MFFCTIERLPTQLFRSASQDTAHASSVAAPQEYYDPENKQKSTEPERERMSNDLMELNDAELNYIYFETDSDYANNRSDKDFVVTSKK